MSKRLDFALESSLKIETEIGIWLMHESTQRRLNIFSGMVIGRSEGDVNFNDDPLVSRRHCEIILTENPRRVFVKDMNSSNRTRINSISLPPEKMIELRFGDILQLGNQRLTMGDERHPNLSSQEPAQEVSRLQDLFGRFRSLTLSLRTPKG